MLGMDIEDTMAQDITGHLTIADHLEVITDIMQELHIEMPITGLIIIATLITIEKAPVIIAGQVTNHQRVHLNRTTDRQHDHRSQITDHQQNRRNLATDLLSNPQQIIGLKIMFILIRKEMSIKKQIMVGNKGIIILGQNPVIVITDPTLR